MVEQLRLVGIIGETVELFKREEEEAARTIKSVLESVPAELERQNMRIWKLDPGVKVNDKDVICTFDMVGEPNVFGSFYVYELLVMERNGHLYLMKVVGEEDDGRWYYDGEVIRELTKREYIDNSPRVAFLIEQRLSDKA